MQERIICMFVILVSFFGSVASMSSINEQILDLTRLCLLTSPDQPQRCLHHTTPILSRRRRFSEAMPRRKDKDRCSMPCQKKQVPINAHSLKNYFGTLLRVHPTHVTFHHPDQHHNHLADPNIMFDMCVGNCRHSMDDLLTRSQFESRHLSVCAPAQSSDLIVRVKHAKTATIDYRIPEWFIGRCKCTRGYHCG